MAACEDINYIWDKTINRPAPENQINVIYGKNKKKKIRVFCACAQDDLNPF